MMRSTYSLSTSRFCANCCAALLVAVVACSAANAAKQPNVILILADDQGYGDMSCHGNPVLKTPSMDRLYSESVRFTDFHVAPMCSPTRGQLMTGIDAMRNGCTAVCEGRSMMRQELPTMANYFADSGYSTGHFGKWHLGDSYPHRPQDRGFQKTIHHRAWGFTSLADHWGNTYFDPVLSEDGIEKKFDGYCTDIFFGQAMKWIKSVRSDDKPFFVYLPTNTPHVPDVCAEKYSAPYIGKHDGKPMPAKFYGMIANLDENVGKLESFLQTEGLRENTILIYMSDNGTQSKDAMKIFNAGMRLKKTSVYEGGHRVPFFIRWPNGKLQHGKDVSELAQVQDVLPTLIDFCGLKRDVDAPVKFNGTSLSGLMKGTADELPKRKLVIQYRSSGAPWDPAVVLSGKWRLVSGKELYHIGRDPGQKRNLAQKNPKIFSELRAHYDDWYKEAKELFDRKRWIAIGTQAANPMILYAQDWEGHYCDNQGGLTQMRAGGHWNVDVDREGNYEIELRRFSRESKKTMTEGIAGPNDTGLSARPIHSANLQIADGNYTLDATAGGTHVTFVVRLPAGKTSLATMLLDSEGRSLCSAPYVYLQRLDDSAKPSMTPPSGRKPIGLAPGPIRGKKKPNPSK